MVNSIRPRSITMMACLTMFVALLAATPARAQTAYAVTQTTNSLISFDVSTPGTVNNLGPIKGPTGTPLGTQIVAMDFRPLTGRLYALDNNSTLYIIDPVTAIATPQPALTSVITGNAGFDFDPFADRIRVVTDSGQNVRLTLGGPSTTVTTDIPVNGAPSPNPPVVTGLAFTNNFASPDRDTLFGIDSANARLVRIGAADALDNGASQTTGVVTGIGPLGVAVDALDGFDIAANDNRAYAALGTGGGSSTLYKINLQTGAATGGVAIGIAERVRALALFTRAVTLYGLTTSNQIVTFLSAAPNTLLPPGTTTPTAITGLNAGENVLGIDVRPATGEVYGVTSANRVVTINPVSGVASAKATLSIALTGTEFGIDFNPVVDRLRIISDNGQNLRVNPDTGDAIADGAVGVTNLSGIGYTNNVAGAASTVLYGIATAGDGGGDQLMTINPTTGATTLVAALTTPAGPLNTSAITALDIAGTDGSAFLAVNAPGGATPTQIYVLNLVTGVANLTGNGGTIGSGLTLRGIAVASPGRVRFSSTAYSVLESADAGIVIERIGGSDGPITAKITASNGTATGADYTAGEYTVEFLTGQTTNSITVPITHDAVHESDETVNLTLSDPRQGASLTTPSASVLTIIDDDPSGVGTPPTVTITDPSNTPTFNATSLFVTLAGTATDDGTIQQVRWSNDRGFSGTAILSTVSGVTQWFGNSVQLRPGANVITVTATDNDGNNGVATITITVSQLQYYLAEGAIGGFFDTDLLIANPNNAPAPITITYLKLGGGTVTQNVTVQPTSRITILVDNVPGLENEGEISTVVTSSAGLPLLVERTMRWDSTGYGASGDHAVDGTRSKWYFAEGSQGFFHTYILLANPNAVVNKARVTFLREFGNPPVVVERDLPANSRVTLDVGAVPEVNNQSFGAIVEFLNAPGAAERSMYFGLSPLFLGGHESAGVTLPSPEWFLAEGATGPFFETFVLVANPNDEATNVDITYLPSFGGPVQKPTFVLGPKERKTINIEVEATDLNAPILKNAAVSTKVVANRPVLVERAQYWPDPFTDWYETHNAFGLTALDTKWGLAEGRVGGASIYNTFILLANPGSTAADVTMTFLRENGSTVTKTFHVDPQSRFNVNVAPVTADSAVPELKDESFGVIISSTQPIAVERAMYSNGANGTGATWQAGTNATAVHLP
jgi:hypothetical protein